MKQRSRQRRCASGGRLAVMNFSITWRRRPGVPYVLHRRAPRTGGARGARGVRRCWRRACLHGARTSGQSPSASCWDARGACAGHRTERAPRATALPTQEHHRALARTTRTHLQSEAKSSSLPTRPCRSRPLLTHAAMMDPHEAPASRVVAGFRMPMSRSWITAPRWYLQRQLQNSWWAVGRQGGSEPATNWPRTAGRDVHPAAAWGVSPASNGRAAPGRGGEAPRHGHRERHVEAAEPAAPQSTTHGKKKPPPEKAKPREPCLKAATAGCRSSGRLPGCARSSAATLACTCAARGGRERSTRAARERAVSAARSHAVLSHPGRSLHHHPCRSAVDTSRRPCPRPQIS